MANRAINSLVKIDPSKLAFMMLPPFIRRMIPLSWWPKYCQEQQAFYDVLINDFEAVFITWSAERDNILCRQLF